MREIFVDTSAWYAIEDASDANNEIALLFREEIAERYRLVTSSYILDETYTLLLLNIGYVHAVEFKHLIDVMSESGILIVVHVSESIEKAGWDVFEQFNTDKEWSFTDYTSKVIMEQRKISEAFAFDHHFEQMGLSSRHFLSVFIFIYGIISVSIRVLFLSSERLSRIQNVRSKTKILQFPQFLGIVHFPEDLR